MCFEKREESNTVCDKQTEQQFYMHWTSVFPAGCEMGNNTCMGFFADINSIHFDYALSRLETSSSSYSSLKKK